MMKPDQPTFYTLDAEHNAVPTDDVLVWGRWFSKADNRRVSHTDVSSECRVSTVCIGVDHRWFGNGPPLIFETMIFGGPLDGEMWRYSSWDDAETGHAVAVRKARKAAGQKVK